MRLLICICVHIYIRVACFALFMRVMRAYGTDCKNLLAARAARLYREIDANGSSEVDIMPEAFSGCCAATGWVVNHPAHLVRFAA